MRHLLFCCGLLAIIALFCSFDPVFGNEIEPAVTSVSSAVDYYIDCHIGHDTNDGSFESPFASFAPLQKISDFALPSLAFNIHITPGEYSISQFNFSSANLWVFRKCEKCPGGQDLLDDVSRPILQIVAPNPTVRGMEGIFQSRMTDTSSAGAMLQFFNIDFRPASADSFSVAIFWIQASGLLLDSCSVANFVLTYSEAQITDSVEASGLISISRAELRLLRSEFRNNSLIFLDPDITPRSATPMFGETTGHLLEVVDCTFEFNLIEAPMIQGGLLACIGPSIIRGTSFISNSGYVTRVGLGMAISSGYLCHLSILDSSFIDNRLEVLDTDWAIDLFGPYGVTYGAALGVATTTGTVSIDGTLFDANVATQGGAIAVGTGKWDGSTTRFVLEGQLSMLISSSKFQRNNATSGVGAAILLQGSNLGYLVADTLRFDSNVGGKEGVARKVYPGVPPTDSEQLDASVIFGVELVHPLSFISFENIIFSANSTIEDGKEGEEGGELTPTLYRHLVHRTLISGVNDIVFTNIRYEKVAPGSHSATGSLISLRDVWSSAVIDGVDLDLLVPYWVSQDPIWNAWTPGPFIFLENGDKSADFTVSRLKLSDWSDISPKLSIMVARGMENIVFSKSAILNTAGTQEPLILIDNCVSVLFEDNRIESFSGTFQFQESDSVHIERVLMQGYSGSNAIIRLDQIFVEIEIDQFIGFNSTASFIYATSFGVLGISNSQMEDATISSLDGAITMVQGGYFNANTLFVSSMRGVQGSVISATLVSALRIQSCAFNVNRASQSGGAIRSDACDAIAITDSHFFENVALNGDGGALWTACNMISLFNTSFSTCEATGSGGAIHVQSPHGSNSLMANTQMLTIFNSSFLQNRAGVHGGSLSLVSLSTAILESRFENNRAQSSGGAAKLVLDPNSLGIDSHFTNCLFFNNSARRMGGAVALEPSEPIEEPLRIYFGSNLFAKNEAVWGGAIAASANLNFDHGPNHFIDNFAEEGACLWISSIEGVTFQLFGEVDQESRRRSNITNLMLEKFLLSPKQMKPRISKQTFESNRCSSVGSILALTRLEYTRLEEASNQAWLSELWRNNTFIGQGNRTSLLGAPFVLRPYRTSISSLDEHIQYSSKVPLLPVSIGAFFPGIARSFLIGIQDGLGQTGINANYSQLQGVTRLDKCTSETGGIMNFELSHSLHPPTASEVMGIKSENPQLVLSMLVTRLPSDQGVVEPLKETVKCVMTFSTTFQIDLYDFEVKPCGFGTGLAQHSSECHVCPLSSYSMQGECLSCSEDPHVECFAGTVRPVRNYWVDIDVQKNQYQVLRCPNGFCTPSHEEENFNPCSPNRKGIMCGECEPGLHESILTQCSACTKPNWIIICLAIAGLWVAVLILHGLVAVSSGKATILIFFVQACFIINYQISISDMVHSKNTNTETTLPHWIAFVLCIIPLNSLERTLLLGMVPFIMMSMLGITFAARMAMKKIWNLCRLCRPISTSYQPLTSESDTTPFEPSIFATYEEIEDDQTEKRNDFGYSGPIELETEYSEDEIFASDGLGFESGNDDAVDQLETSNHGEENEKELRGEEVVQQMMDDQEKDRFEALYRWQQQMAFWHPYRLIRTVLSLLAGSFSSVLGIAISTIDCVTLLNGQSVLQSAPAISCSSKQVSLFRNLNGLWVPYMVLLFIGLLWKLVDGYRKKALSSMDVRFGVWYEMYKPKMFAWKLTEMIRRLVLSFAGKLLLYSPLRRSITLFAISVAFLAIHLLTMPYRQKLENSLETLSLTALAFISIVNIRNAQLFGVVDASKGTFVLAWVTCWIVAAAIVVAIVFVKVKGKAQGRL
jgi:hypothetical protein